VMMGQVNPIWKRAWSDTIGQNARPTIAFEASLFFQAHQEIEWVILGISERRKHACEDLEPQILVIAQTVSARSRRCRFDELALAT